MEGLIPMVYKAMKKNIIRRQYSNLPSSATTSAASRTNYNIADFYPDPSQISYAYVAPPASNDHHVQLQRRILNANGTSTALQESSTTNMSQGHLQHRRHQTLSGGDHNKYGTASFKGFSSQFTSVEADSPPPKQLARFGRHRRMFSCMSCVS